MTEDPTLDKSQVKPCKVARQWRRRVLRVLGWLIGGVTLSTAVLVALAVLFLSRVPRSYPVVSDPIPPPVAESHRLGGGLAGFDSPYLGHTGSWDGKGGGIFGRSKIADLDREKGMGLRWTFMPVYWRVMEPKGPVDLTQATPTEWKAVDAFVIAAHERGLNILMQAPVMGGNAGGPPDWAGRRRAGSSAPRNMKAAADFAGKLAARYCPGGTLAVQQGWGNAYGVRAWELDNEPEGYRTSWKEQARDYAEFVCATAAEIKRVDQLAVTVAPGIAGGGNGLKWLAQALGDSGRDSPSIGTASDVVSFHSYEGLDSALSKEDRTIERAFMDIRALFQQHEQNSIGMLFPGKQEYWHTEGNFDFLGILSQERRAAWRFQFFTRAFAAGIRKVCVMDASPAEQKAVRAYVAVLPNPFPMLRATDQLKVISGRAEAFIHTEPNGAGQVWVLWAVADSGDAVVEAPAAHSTVAKVDVKGASERCAVVGNKVRLVLKGDRKMAPGVLVIDRPFDAK